MLIVGERRSKKAVRMGVRWEDGRLAAAALFPALEAAGIDPRAVEFTNFFERGGPTRVRVAARAGSTIIALGRRVEAALVARGVPHIFVVHPAARGSIRRRENYIAHVRAALAAVTRGT